MWRAAHIWVNVWVYFEISVIWMQTLLYWQIEILLRFILPRKIQKRSRILLRNQKQKTFSLHLFSSVSRKEKHQKGQQKLHHKWSLQIASKFQDLWTHMMTFCEELAGILLKNFFFLWNPKWVSHSSCTLPLKMLGSRKCFNVFKISLFCSPRLQSINQRCEILLQFQIAVLYVNVM